MVPEENERKSDMMPFFFFSSYWFVSEDRWTRTQMRLVAFAHEKKILLSSTAKRKKSKQKM